MPGKLLTCPLNFSAFKSTVTLDRRPEGPREIQGSHKLDGNQNVFIASDSVHDSVAYDPVKTRLSESETEAEEPTNHKAQLGNEHCDWFILSILLPTPTIKLSLHRKRRSHKQNQCCALPTPLV